MALSCLSPTLHRHDPSFVYFQLLKDILLHDTFDENEDEADMLDFCRKTFSHSPSILVLLNEFGERFDLTWPSIGTQGSLSSTAC